MVNAPSPRTAKRTVVEVNAIRTPGRHSIGGGLLLSVTTSGSRSWLARVTDPAGRRRDIGLGTYPDVGLKEARDRVSELKRQVRDGLDPVAEKRKARIVVPSFKDAAKRCHDERKGGFRNIKHSAQWLSSLEVYVYPKFGTLPVDQVTGALIVDALKPIWTKKPETASRVLQRVGTVLAWACAHEMRETEAPMRSIRMGLPPQPVKAAEDRHHAALPYGEVSSFVKHLRAQPESIARLCLEFIILTAARSGEARGAQWKEIDLDKALWTLPADRMKAKKTHVVPLCARALEIVKGLNEVRSHKDLIFPGLKATPISDAAVSKALRVAGVVPARGTVHGFRSSFRDWVSEETNTPSEIAEMALAHAIPNKVEAAYRRGGLLEKRRKLMDAWEAYLDGASADVVQLKAGAS